MEKIKKIRLITIIIFSLSTLWGGEIDILLDKLVDENILTGSEAQEIRYETQEKVKKEISLGTHKTLPLWLHNITLGGDIRIRYQKDDNKNITYKQGDFQFVYSRRWLEKDSWLDAYPDSDFYSGATDVKGDRYTLSYGIARDFAISANYFNSKPIKNNKKEEKIIQIDIITKF